MTTTTLPSSTSGTAAALVSIREVSFRYGDRLALDNLSFNVSRGEIYGLLGPNGGGKTTLFRILSTLSRPAAGSVEIAGAEYPGNPSGVRSRIGVVFQYPSLDKKLKVIENMRHQGHLYRLSGSNLENRITKLLAAFGLTDRAADLVETLSGGLQRRVEIAKAMLHEPAVLLLDEPSTGLDPSARLDLWSILDRFRTEKQVTVLMTTHLMEEADRCDRVAILHQGKLVAEGPPFALRESIGGDVIQIQAADVEALAGELAVELKDYSVRVVDQQIRVEAREGIDLVGTIMNRFGQRIQSISLSKPTLEDVFVKKTGTRLLGEASNEVEAPSGH